MILGFLRRYKKFAAVVGLLLMLMGIMAWQLRSEIRKNSALEADNEQLQQAHKTNQQAIQDLKNEIERREQALAHYQEQVARIEHEAQQKRHELESRLAALRAEYESVQDFLSIPVPSEFVDGWMRSRATGSDGDEGGED